MQQMQLWIFWAIVAVFLVCGCVPHAETEKKATNGNLAASGAPTNISAAVSLSKKKGAVVGRAAGEPYRSLKKLNQVCDPGATRY